MPGEKSSIDPLEMYSNRTRLEELMKSYSTAKTIDVVQFSNYLKSRVIGQNSVCEEVPRQINQRMALEQRGKPLGVFLFAGYPGTGKTYLAKIMAEYLGRKLLHLDMTNFANAHAASQLFGSPKGYAGSDTYGTLTGGLRDIPNALVLLDEIEKSDPDVMKRFLTAWNDGFLTEASNGQGVGTTKAIFVLTTNAAVEKLDELANQLTESPEELRRGATTALWESGFAPEVLSRIDHIFVFKRLQGLDIARVAALEIASMIHSYGLESVREGISPDFLFDIMQRLEKMGTTATSRDLTRLIERNIADQLIAVKQHNYKKVRLKYEGGGVIVEAVQ